MPINRPLSQKGNSPYSAVMTREQFLFHEMRITAKLMMDGLSDQEIIDEVYTNNLYQYPTEKMIKSMARTCIRRLSCLGDESLVAAIVNESSDTAKQICLYGMMKQYRLMWDFMITVIGDKYSTFDTTFTKMDLNVFFIRLQEQDTWVASWSDSTITKLKSVIHRILIDNEYLENEKSEILLPVLISPILENAIRENGDSRALIAFNCLS